jgi:hypothetical protein
MAHCKICNDQEITEYNKQGELLSRQFGLEDDLVVHKFMSATSLRVSFTMLKKAGRRGLIRDLELSYKDDQLKALVVNGETISACLMEGELLNEDIVHITNTYNHPLMERYQQLAEIILPIQESILLQKESLNGRRTNIKRNRI